MYWESLCFLLFIKCWPYLSGNHLAVGAFALQSDRDSTLLPFAPEICFSVVVSSDLISLLTMLCFKQTTEASSGWCKSAWLYQSQWSRGILHQRGCAMRLSTELWARMVMLLHSYVAAKHCLTSWGVVLRNSRLPGRWLATSFVIISGMDRKLLYCCCLVSCAGKGPSLLLVPQTQCLHVHVHRDLWPPIKHLCKHTDNLQSWPGAVPWAEPLLVMLLKRKSESTSGSWICAGCPGDSVSSCECE